MKKLFLLLIAFTCLLNGYSQGGGDTDLKFLELPSSARSAAMGGNFISVKDNDINLVYDNPALISGEMDDWISFNIVDYVSSVSYGNLTYAHKDKNDLTWVYGMQYVNFGKFYETYSNGQATGNTFSGGDYAGSVSLVRKMSRKWNMGFTGKLVYSSYYDNNALALSFDIGVHYANDSELFQFGAVLNDFGVVLMKYDDADKTRLPFNINVGLSQKFEKAPLRLTLTTLDWQTPDLTFNANSEIGTPALDENGNIQSDESAEGMWSANNLLSHFVFGAEILASENFYLSLSYNLQRSLQMGEGSGAAGLGVGFGMKIKKFHFSYALSNYFAGKSANTFTLSSNLNKWKKS